MPNEYLFTEYRKTIPGGEKMLRWEVYAYALRDFMAERGGYGINEQPLRDRVSLNKFMWSESDSCTTAYQDPPKTFYYPHDPKKTGDVSKNYPPKYLIKETSRLTDLDFITLGKKMVKAKVFK